MGCGSSTVLQPVQDAQTVEFDRLMEEEKAEAQLHFKVRRTNERTAAAAVQLQPPCAVRVAPNGMRLAAVRFAVDAIDAERMIARR